LLLNLQVETLRVALNFLDSLDDLIFKYFLTVLDFGHSLQLDLLLINLLIQSQVFVLSFQPATH
jgi:hypothetical protein